MSFQFQFDQHPFDFMSRKKLWFGISMVMLVPGLIAILLCMLQFGTPTA